MAEMKRYLFADLRREAGTVLSRDANRLKLIEAILICATPLPCYLVADSAFRLAVLPLTDPYSEPAFYIACVVGYGILLSLFTLFLTLPLFCGLINLATGMERGEDADLPDVFSAFSSRENYRRALSASFAVFWRVGFLIATENGIGTIAEQIFGRSVGIRLLTLLLQIAVALLWAVLCMRRFRYVYCLLTRGRGTFRMQPREWVLGWFYWIGFFPWLVLSLLTVGILFLADVLPRMLAAYCCLCRKLNETIQSEEIENE